MMSVEQDAGEYELAANAAMREAAELRNGSIHVDPLRHAELLAEANQSVGLAIVAALNRIAYALEGGSDA